jgi:glycosyltransferase involved in cell wall biosynthesis
MTLPLLPLKPYALVVFDYIQRYQPVIPAGGDMPFLLAARNASGVLVTTKFTRDDAAQNAGIDPRLIHLVPHMIPIFGEQERSSGKPEDYFVWPTNIAAHKNHFNALSALRLYYEDLGGSLKCRVTGVNPQDILSGKFEHLAREKAIFDSSRALKRNLVMTGELPDTVYQKHVAEAQFVWHTAVIDNGTFAAVEAACVGVPTLSSRYPAMEEMNEMFGLNVTWFDQNDPRQMALGLKRMESEARRLRSNLPSRKSLEAKGVEHAAPSYWRAVRACL